MKKRLRKKLRLGEFQEFGFPVTVHFKETPGPEELQRFLEMFIHEAVEANQLLCVAVGPGDGWSCFLIGEAARIPVSDAQREAVKTWAEMQPAVASCDVGDLEDAWYGKEI